MQDAIPFKRPVGRPRLSTSNVSPQSHNRVPSSPAIGATQNSIATSNETTNYFLGGGVLHRPWMRPNASGMPREQPTNPPTIAIRQTTFTPASTATCPPLAATTTASNHGDELSQSPVAVGRPLPPYRFIPSILATPLQGTSNTRAGSEAQVSSTSRMERIDGNQPQEQGGPRDERPPQNDIDVMDLTNVEEHEVDAAEPAQEVFTNVMPYFQDANSTVSNTFPQLPTLEMNEDFDLLATDAPTGSIHALTSHNDSSFSKNATQMLGTAAAQYTIPNGQRRSTLDQSQLIHQKIATSLAMGHDNVSVSPTTGSRRSPAQLLTPEQSPLISFQQQLPQKRPSTELQTSRPPPDRPSSSAQSHRTTPQVVHHLQHSVAGGHPGSNANEGNVAQVPQTSTQHHGSIHDQGLLYLATLKSAVERLSRRMDIKSVPWNLRFPWLQEACQRTDLFFLQLNQLFCMWSMHKDSVQQLGLGQDCDSGFAVLERLLGSNSQIQRELLAFLATWPNTRDSLEKHPQLRHGAGEIARFLPLLGSKWPMFRQGCVKRKVPPMTVEIYHGLFCPLSIILPSAIFCSLHRQILPNAPTAVSYDAYVLFRENMREVYASQPDSAIFPRYHASYRNVFLRHIYDTGLSEIQLTELRATLHHLTLTSPQSSTSAVGQPQSHIHNFQASSSVAQPLSTHQPAAPNYQPRQMVYNTDGRAIITSSSNVPPYYQTAAMTGQTPLNPSMPTRTLGSNDTSVRGVGPVRGPFAQTHALVAQTGTSTQPGGNTSRMQASLAHVNGSITSNNIWTQYPHGRRPSTKINPPSIATGQAPPTTERLLPVSTQKLPAFLVNPNPTQEALHQVHLRQPNTELSGLDLGDGQILFQYIQNLVLKPHCWLPSSGFVVVSFDIPSGLLQRRPALDTVVAGPFETPKRVIGLETLVFNLRCAKLDESKSTEFIESSWAALPTYWPQHIFISINGEHLEIRRKRQHGRDLPIDVTSLVKEGKNEVKISIHPEQNERNIMHGLAVEAIGFQTYDAALVAPTEISTEESLKAITSTMSPQEDPTNDDIVLIDSSMTISITDPFSSRIFARPVRGKSCKHRECFDLEIFMKSRQSDHKDSLSSVYGWQCPICKGDARPCSLVVDRFFQDVRDQLVKSGKDDVRAIVVKVDGTWEPKQELEEAHTTNRGGSKEKTSNFSVPPTRVVGDRRGSGAPVNGSLNATKPSNTTTAASASTTQIPRPVEVIELD